MNTKERFEQEFEFTGMAKNSLRFINRNTQELVYMHRNNVNRMSQAVDYRIVKMTFDGDRHKYNWVELCFWAVR